MGASAFLCMRAGFLCPKCDNFACLHTRQDQNELHLKIWFFFFAKIDKSNVAILPRVVQAYTQSYSFGARIKLIICQIRHEPSVTIHEISISRKKMFDGGSNTRALGILGFIGIQLRFSSSIEKTVNLDISELKHCYR